MNENELNKAIDARKDLAIEMLLNGVEEQVELGIRLMTLLQKLVDNPPVLHLEGQIPEVLDIEAAISLARRTAQHVIQCVVLAYVKSDFKHLEYLAEKGVFVPQLPMNGDLDRQIGSVLRHMEPAANA